MTYQEAYEVLDLAFSNFFVFDMNTRRCETHDLDKAFAKDICESDAIRVGNIIGYLAEDKFKVAEALQMWEDERHTESEEIVQGREGPVLFSYALADLCLTYQLDEHRKHVIDAYVRCCVAGIRSQVGEIL